jgi:hypothetical protein
MIGLSICRVGGVFYPAAVQSVTVFPAAPRLFLAIGIVQVRPDVRAG